MKATLLKSLPLLLAVLLTSATTFAQPPRGSNADQPGRQQVRAYYQTHVLPVVRQQRQKLEAQLAADDKAQLAIYRQQLQELHQRGKALRESLKPAAGATEIRPVLTDAQKQQLQELRSANREIMVKVGLLAQKYEAPLQQLTQEIQPQQQQWTADLRAIAAKSAAPEQLEKRKHFGEYRRGHDGLGHFFRPTRFLLLDPHAPAASPGVRPETGLNVYPNPAVASNQLEYSVKKAGPVTIEILDGRGNTLRPVVENQPQEKGSHTLSTDLSDLPAGTYFYKITTRSGTETKRFGKQ